MAAVPQNSESSPELDPSRWVRRGPPGLGLWDPASLAENDIRALWRFRLRYVDLKPAVDPRDDFAAFTAFLRQASDVWVWLDGRELLGTSIHHTGQLEFDGQRRYFVQSDYGFIARRGRALAMLSQAWVYTRMILAHPRSPTYVAGFVYPHSHLVYASTLSNCWLLGEPGMPAGEQAFAEHLAQLLGGKGWDPARRRYSFPTLPRERRVATSAPGRAEALARYEALNPAWQDGYGLFMLARVGPRSILEACGSMVSRARRARGRRQ